MTDRAIEATDEDGSAIPNKRCRDQVLLLLMLFSAMRGAKLPHCCGPI